MWAALFSRWCLNCEIDIGGLRKVIELQQFLGAVPAPLAVESIIDLRFLRAESEPSAV